MSLDFLELLFQLRQLLAVVVNELCGLRFGKTVDDSLVVRVHDLNVLQVPLVLVK